MTDEIIDVEAEDEPAPDGTEVVRASVLRRREGPTVLTPQDRYETFAEWMMRWDNFKRAVREIDRQCKEEAIAYLKANGPQYVGDTKYYAGRKKEVACTDMAQALDALLEACDGDLTIVAQHLAARAIKVGAARKTLDPKIFNALFETIESDEMRAGKAPPHLMAVNTKYLPD